VTVADAEHRVEARSHLDIAHEFLDNAESAFELGASRAAGSDAVLAGIRAKDAIAVAILGRTGKNRDHRDAVKELESALAGRSVANDAIRALDELLSSKTDVQYGTKAVTEAKVKSLLRRARRLVEIADEVVSQS